MAIKMRYFRNLLENFGFKLTCTTQPLFMRTTLSAHRDWKSVGESRGARAKHINLRKYVAHKVIQMQLIKPPAGKTLPDLPAPLDEEAAKTILGNA